MDAKDIPLFISSRSCYRIHLDWEYLETYLQKQSERCEGMASLDLNPDFQRGYVWKENQKTAYVEYILRGGTSGRDIYCNCIGWGDSYEGPYVLVGGKQRLEAVRGFIANRVKAFGHYCKDITGLRLTRYDFLWHVNSLATRAEVLTWYLEMNSGGTVHAKAELDRVRDLLEKEKP